MQPNGPQNYWQPQDVPDDTRVPATPPSQSASPPTVAPSVPVNSQPVTSQPSTVSQPAIVTPHDEVFVPPKDAHMADHDENVVMSWEASEYIDHEKDILWFLGFSIVVLIFLAIALWVQAWTFVFLIIIMAIATIAYIRRPPRTLRYSLSDKGLHIGQQFHSYGEFRAYGIVNDGPLYAIMLVSTKRFMPATLIYFAEQDGEKIIETIGDHLPFEDLRLDLADDLIRKLRL